jgi:hypothetical protein
MGNYVFQFLQGWKVKGTLENMYVIKVINFIIARGATQTEIFCSYNEVNICNIILVYCSKSKGMTEMFGGKTER